MKPGMCHVLGVLGGRDGGLLQVAVTFLSPFFTFTKPVAEAWKAWLFEIISFTLFHVILFLIYFFLLLCIRVRLLAQFQP